VHFVKPAGCPTAIAKPLASSAKTVTSPPVFAMMPEVFLSVSGRGGMSLFDYPEEQASAQARSLSAPRLTFLGDLTEDSWKKILALVETRHFRRGDEIIRYADRDDSFYILTSGSVEVVVPTASGGGTVVAQISEGSVFGEIAFFDGEPRSATIRASEDGSAVRITRKNFEQLAAWHPQIARQMLYDLGRILALRLRSTTGQVRK
jgi:CRP-like cAMP-binding protein